MAIQRYYTKSARRATWHPVSDTQPFYHGTQAEEFDAVEPGTSLTGNPGQARGYAGAGSYFGVSQHGDPRVLELRVSLPRGAPVIPASPRYHKAIYSAGEVGNVDAEQSIREAYHREAQEEAERLGLDAYYSDLYDDPTEDLVILKSDVARIYKQDVMDTLDDPAPTDVVRFTDVPPPVPQEATPARSTSMPAIPVQADGTVDPAAFTQWYAATARANIPPDSPERTDAILAAGAQPVGMTDLMGEPLAVYSMPGGVVMVADMKDDRPLGFRQINPTFAQKYIDDAAQHPLTGQSPKAMQPDINNISLKPGKQMGEPEPEAISGMGRRRSQRPEQGDAGNTRVNIRMV